MFLLMSIIASSCFVAIAAIFATYYTVVLRNPMKTRYLRDLDDIRKRTLAIDRLPKVTVLMAMYNEETMIREKLAEIFAMEYPHEKLEVILVDDHSTDSTVATAEKQFAKLGLRGEIIRNNERVGINECFNIGVAHSTGDLIATTGPDIIVEHRAMLEALKVLVTMKHVAGVSGKPTPTSHQSSNTLQIEKSYRDFYDSMCVAESAIHSTFPGYTGFAVIARSAFARIPAEYGSTDGNLSLAIVRRGLRFVCAPNVAFYEEVAGSLPEQMRQKTRRASRTIQSALANTDLLFRKECGAFGSVIFPLRLLMITLAPLLFLVGVICALIAVSYVSMWGSLLLIVILACVRYVGSRVKLGSLGLVHSLAVHECYLLIGLFLSGARRGTWKHNLRS